MTTPIPLHDPRNAIFVLRLRGSIRRVRLLLKSLGNHGWRCVSAREDPAINISLSPEEVQMERSDLEKLKAYAASSRSEMGMGGAALVKFDYKTGKCTAGRAGDDIAGRKFVADVPDLMAGFQRLEAGKKPIYALVRVLDSVTLIARAELGDTDPERWLNRDKDPYTAVSVLPLHDPQTMQPFVFPAAFSARGAVSDLLQAYIDHCTAHPEDANKLPVVEFYVRDYPKGDSSKGYALQFDVVDWVARDERVPHLRPPTLNITETGSKTEPATKPDSPDKPQRKVHVEGAPDPDPEIPF
jgi:hypothetical protein